MDRLAQFAVFLAAIHCGLVNARFGLDSALSQWHLDPLGVNDSFFAMPAAVKRSLLNPLNFDTDEKLDQLHSLASATLLNVKLVGFSSGDRSLFQAQFARYLEAFNQEERVGVIGAYPHEFTVKLRIDLQISSATGQLSEKIFEAIEKNLADRPAPSMYSRLDAVPHSVVDDLVQADLEKPLTSYYIYLLNPKHQKTNYAYRYSEEPGPYSYSCLGSSWVSGDRYMWIDLAAGPVEWGPSLSGEGLVVKSETHPLAALHKGSPARSSYLADLASVVWSAAQMLLQPPLRVPVYFDPNIMVHFIHIGFGRDGNGSQVADIDWGAIESIFAKENGKSFAFGSQSIEFKRFRINGYKCASCSASLARATKTYSSRILLDRYSLFVNEYIDSKQMHYLVSQGREEIERLAGIDSRFRFRAVPVYVFDLPRDKVLLLDRHSQAIAFRDMVIVVRTAGSHLVSDFSCNGRPVMTRASDLERNIVGALLQTVWGVAPTHLRWSSQHNSSLVDYTWSVGQTPFGPFSYLLSLSFVQKDAAPRNVLFTMLNVSIWTATDILNSLKDYGGEKKLLGRKEHAEFTQRWNLLLFKLNKAMALISHFDFDAALYFVKSSEHDTLALYNLVSQATSSLQASIVCFKDPPFPWHWILVSLFLAGVTFYLWIRRDKLFVNKKKKF